MQQFFGSCHNTVSTTCTGLVGTLLLHRDIRKCKVSDYNQTAQIYMICNPTIPDHTTQLCGRASATSWCCTETSTELLQTLCLAACCQIASACTDVNLKSTRSSHQIGLLGSWTRSNHMSEPPQDPRRPTTYITAPITDEQWATACKLIHLC